MELTFVIDRRADPSANAMFVGPTAIDFGMLDRAALNDQREARLFKLWEAEDLDRHYKGQM